MGEEAKEEEEVVENSSPEGEEIVEQTEAEKEAIAKGWNPEGVEGKRNLSAEEFLDREKFFSAIHSLKRENRKLSEDVQNLVKYQKRVREDERKKVLHDLKAAKKEALANDDYDRVVEIDEAMAEARTPEPEVETNDVADKAARAFEEWSKDNTWYRDNADMRQYADRIGAGIYNEDPKRDPEEFYKLVEKEVKEHYKEKFAAPAAKPNAVEGTSTRGRSRSSGFSEASMSEMERSIMNTVLKTTPGMTKEAYLKEFEEMSRNS